jgi:hypothetical protein
LDSVFGDFSADSGEAGLRIRDEATELRESTDVAADWLLTSPWELSADMRRL